MALPIFQTQNKDLTLLQTRWASELNPVLANPTTNPVILKDVVLTTGVNVINHRLGRRMQGYIICDLDAPVTLYRSAPFNNLTLSLTSSGAATVNVLVF